MTAITHSSLNSPGGMCGQAVHGVGLQAPVRLSARWFNPIIGADSARQIGACPVMYLLYSLVFTFGLIITAPYYLWRHRGKLAMAAWKERLGYLPGSFLQTQPGAIWVHAVSVGETLAAARLIQELRARYPGRRIFLSHVTPAGREAGEKGIPDLAGRFYLPFDWAFCTRRVMKTLRPALLIIVETELWPNLLRVAKQNGCGVALVNGRMSERSFPRYLRFRGLMRRVLSQLDFIGVQSSTDASRFEQVGADPRHVSVTGNLKFDARPPKQSELASKLNAAFAVAERGPVVIAASTMVNEEPLVLQAWRKIRLDHPKCILILAPRHPARFSEAAAMLETQEVSYLRRTDLAESEAQRVNQVREAQALLLDSIGELGSLFQIADLVFMGGTLVPTGGHNLIEPAFWGKAIILGPHMENFREAADLFNRDGAAVQISSSNELGEACSALLANPAALAQLGEKARHILEKQSGATRRTLDGIAPWLDSKEATRAAS